MDLWKGKVSIVTGVNSEIGFAIAKDLIKSGVIVFGLDIALDKLKEFKEEIQEAKVYPVECDFSVEEQIQAAFYYVEQKEGGVDILINCAEVQTADALLDQGNLGVLKKIIDTNLMGLISCTKKAYESMAARDNHGYIINISSVIGREVPMMFGRKPMLNVYASVLRQELNYFQKPKIRVSNISPGVTRPEEDATITYGNLVPGDISNAVLYVLGTNPRIQVEEIIVRPSGPGHQVVSKLIEAL